MKTVLVREIPDHCGAIASKNPPEGKISRRLMITSSAAVLASGAVVLTHPAVAHEATFEPIIQPNTNDDMAFIKRAFEMQQRAVELGDRAYGAVIVRDNVIIGQSWSRVVIDGDPTAHAEMAAIRDAAMRIKQRRLDGAVMYSSSRPCPMCEAAAYWAGIGRLVHGSTAINGGPPGLCG